MRVCVCAVIRVFGAGVGGVCVVCVVCVVCWVCCAECGVRCAVRGARRCPLVLE